MREVVPPESVETFDVCFMPSVPILSNHIADRIKEKGYTYKETAAKIGSSRQALDSYVRGELQPTVEIALKLAYLLDVPVEELFQLEDGAWYASAKDESGHTIFYDHWKGELLSGDAMKGKPKTIRYHRQTGETMTATAFKHVVGEAEKQAVKNTLSREGKAAHNRDTLARIKEEIREHYYEEYPIRYEALYRRIPRLDERR